MLCFQILNNNCMGETKKKKKIIKHARILTEKYIDFTVINFN